MRSQCSIPLKKLAHILKMIIELYVRLVEVLGHSHQSLKKYSNLCIIIIDLPEAIILQSYYLLKLYPEKKFCFYNDFIKLSPDELKSNNYDFIIIPPWTKQKIINLFKIDYFINTHSFQEMDKEIVSDYFKFINKTIRVNGIFYCLNKYSKTINNKPIKFLNILLIATGSYCLHKKDGGMKICMK